MQGDENTVLSNTNFLNEKKSVVNTFSTSNQYYNRIEYLADLIS